jgi:anaerobic magnesium-protoporphyrin IX monomethyl ester cyclase
LRKVLLVSSPFEDRLRFTTPLELINYPLGISYLHSTLEQKGYQVKTSFYNNETYESYYNKIKKDIYEFMPEIIGINIMTMNRVTSFKTIEYIHENHPNMRIILGGIHPSIMYKQILERYPYVTIVIGEGEITLPEHIEKDIVKGIAYYKDGKVILTPSRELIDDLDMLPFPKHELFYNEKRNHAYIISSRGCPFKCSFCCLHTISRRKYRMRSVENVIKEIDYLMDKFPNLKTIEFSDDTLLLDIERAKRLMKEIIKKNYNIRFRCSARFTPFTLELAQLMKKAGFHTIMFGLETGSRQLLRSIHKNITPEDVLKTWKIIAKTKIYAIPFFIVGLPGETEETITESIILLKQMKKIKHFWFYDVGILTVYPNTEVYDIMKEKGMINDNYWIYGYDMPFYTVEHDEDELLRLKNRIIFESMSGLDIVRFIVSFVLVTYKKSEKPRFWKDKLLIPIIKKIVLLGK